jgi:predicted kinase
VITAGEVVDHIIPHKGDYELFWDEGNWQTLCKRCHDVKTATEDGGFGAAPRYRPNDLLPSLIPLTVICGAPGSGKSTLANERASERDLVIDLDVIKAQVTGSRIYERQDDKAWNAAIVKRNQILYDLGRKRMAKQAFFIISAPSANERRWWKDALRPKEIIVLDTLAEVCIERIKADPRRPVEVQVRHIEAVKSWWQRYTS